MKKMITPLISIIIATYNRANYLNKAIQSVLGQTFTDWELLIWNDGSTDNTEEVVSSYNDKRIHYYNEENHGKCYALNQSIKKARGAWVAILDDDDQWYQKKLEKQIELIFDYPEISILFTNYNNLNLVSGEVGIGFQQNKKGVVKLITKRIKEGVFIVQDQFYESLLRSNFILPSTVLISKKVFDKIGLFNSDLRNGEDFEFLWRAAFNNFVFAFTEEVLVIRIKPDGSLSSPSIDTYINNIVMLNSCYQYALNNGRDDLYLSFRHAFLNSWQGLAKCYVLMGNRKKALLILYRSLKFGINLRSFILLGKTIVGRKIPKLIGECN